MSSCLLRPPTMAASLLPSPWRIPQVHMHSANLTYNAMCFSFCLKHQKCNFKLYIIPASTIVHYGALRSFAAIDSSVLHGFSQRNHVSLGVLAPNKFQRSKTLLHSSSDLLGDVNDFERQLQELFDSVKTMIKMGKEEDAIDLLQANYEAVKEQIDTGAKGIEQAAILDIILLGYLLVGDLKFVRSLLDMMEKIVDGLKDDEPLLDSVLMHMGSAYSTLGRLQKSMLMYRRALEILEMTYGKNSALIVAPLLGMAKALGSIGRVTKAVEIYHRAIAIVELSRGTESEDLVVPLLALGNLLIKERKAMDAEIPFIRILNIYKKSYGESDGRVGIAMCSLAHVKCAKGDADEAIQLYRNALRIIEDSKYMALDDNIMEKMRIDLAELLHAVGRGKEGRELLEECLLITEKCKGEEHPSSVTHLINLATSYSRSKNFVEAERLLRTSLRIMMKTVGPDDQSITFPMLHLAVTLYHLKQDEEAEQLALEALRIREAAFGKESLPVGEALDCLVAIQTRAGKDETELLELLKRVLRIQEKEFGNESKEVVTTLKKVVFYLDKMGRKDEKFSVQKRLSLLRNKHKDSIQY